jgi:hypothetical protein
MTKPSNHSNGAMPTPTFADEENNKAQWHAPTLKLLDVNSGTNAGGGLPGDAGFTAFGGGGSS